MTEAALDHADFHEQVEKEKSDKEKSVKSQESQWQVWAPALVNLVVSIASVLAKKRLKGTSR